MDNSNSFKQRSDQSKELEKTIELDCLKRKIQELTLENKAIEGELEGCKAEVRQKEEQLEKIYLQLS